MAEVKSLASEWVHFHCVRSMVTWQVWRCLAGCAGPVGCLRQDHRSTRTVSTSAQFWPGNWDAALPSVYDKDPAPDDQPRQPQIDRLLLLQITTTGLPDYVVIICRLRSSPVSSQLATIRLLFIQQFRRNDYRCRRLLPRQSPASAR